MPGSHKTWRRREAQGGGGREGGTLSWKREGLEVVRILDLQSQGWGNASVRQNVKNHKRIASMIVMVRTKAIDWILWERQENYSVPKVISK